MTWPDRRGGTAVAATVLIAAVSTGTAIGHAAEPLSALGCSGCHGSASASPVPPLDGLPAGVIVEAMAAFRSGARPSTVMDRLARGFSDEEIRAIAAWYATRPARSGP